ncbi:alkaline phosphatase family protein [Sphingomonas immobilis]|uniref:Alkaline phosphatase family protein n=1 Tax=Sphingomonas immobilis TaxID=3063997 RepID=A0ABT9A425_9SPHN|nr:alkaline phosphatase family protein [Sphingomonas sp. CA1-15]MDO7844598.1 alkaline phosphatase family protein [Sphingomonas sp. CA1-15]
MSNVILLEFNELTPAVMDRFIAQGHLPAFKRLRDESVAAVTDAGEDPPYLEPWIQWVTVHTGLSYADHKVFDLGDGPKLEAPRIWDMISDAGRAVWVCGSMNAAVRGNAIRGHVLPDPWSTGLRPIPETEFAAFFDFVRTYVQEYTRDKPPLAKSDYLRFVRFMVSHGLSLRTVTDAIRQLAGERSGLGKWRRAAVLDDLMFDVFRHDYQRLRPALATFFLNSTAHYQHYYWRNYDPAAFALAPDDGAQQEYGDAMLFGYQKMDALLDRTLQMAGPDTTVILCTALGQQPLTGYDEDGGKMLFKPLDTAALLRFAGVAEPYTIAPVMAEEFRLYFPDAAAAEAAEAQLATLTIDGKPVLKVRRTEAELYAGCDVIAPPAADALIVAGGSNEPRRFADLFYPIDSGVKSGMHHRDGILWIRTPGVAPSVIERSVSLQEIAPTVLALCGVDAPVAFAMPPMPEVVVPATAQLRAA